jgi:hypothetical protein
MSSGASAMTTRTRAEQPASDKQASSCSTCLAWGVLYGGYCRACYDFRRRHPSAPCAICGRDVPLKNDHSRLCWLQAAAQAENPPVVTEDDLARITCHQLWVRRYDQDARPALRCTNARSPSGHRR